MKYISDKGVNTPDLREKNIFQDIDRNSLFYKTDHHWTALTAFWAFSEVVSYFNDNFGFNIDTNNYYTDLKNYNITILQNTKTAISPL